MAKFRHGMCKRNSKTWSRKALKEGYLVLKSNLLLNVQVVDLDILISKSTNTPVRWVCR
jgi:hypothetical protein